MNKTLTTAANLTLGVSSYVSPEVAVTEIHTEGVLCMSDRSASFETWGEETDLPW